MLKNSMKESPKKSRKHKNKLARRKRMKQLKRDLDSVLKSLKTLTQKVEKIQSQVRSIEKPKTPKVVKAKKAVAKNPGKEKSAYNTMLEIINGSKKGITVEQLTAKTGFNKKKIANLIFKARKQGKVKNEERGVYLKA
jgi:hypothetical protein